MKTPRHWKLLERHPLSAEYTDLSGQAYVDAEDNMRRVGFRKERPIILYEGKILDGWQRRCICVAIGITPTFATLPNDITPEDYVSTFNDHRRHMSQEQARTMAEKRRERVIRAKSLSKSNRQIAAEEGVSESTIRNDVDALRAQGAHVSPPSGSVVDTLGRQQPATRPQDIGDANEDDVLLCERCVRVGPVVNCQHCKILREKQAAKQSRKTKGPKQGAAHFDTKLFQNGLGIVVRQVDALAKHYGAKESNWHKDLLADLKEFKAKFDDRLASLKKGI